MSRHGLGKMPNSALGHLRHCRSPNLHCVRLDLHGSNSEIFETWKGATVQRSFFISFFFCSFSLNGNMNLCETFIEGYFKFFHTFRKARYFGSTVYRFSFWGSWDSCWRPKVWGWISSVVRNLQTGNLISAGTLKIVTWRLIEGIFFNFLLFVCKQFQPECIFNWVSMADLLSWSFNCCIPASETCLMPTWLQGDDVARKQHTDFCSENFLA